MVDPVFHKTEAGLDEIRTRAHKLDSRLRALLLVINGERRQSDLLAQVSGMGVGADAFDALREMGLIETEAAAEPTAAPVVETAPAVSEPPPPPPASPVSPEAGQYQRIYQFYTEVIGAHLGLRGYLMQMKVEKAGTVDALLALREPVHLALRKARGDMQAAEIMDSLDDCLQGSESAPPG